jgi:hypothetical protein
MTNHWDAWIKQVQEEVQAGAKGETGECDVDLRIHYFSVKPSNSKQTHRAMGIRVQMTKLAIVALVLGLFLAYGVAIHDPQLIHAGLDTFKTLLSPDAAPMHRR